MLVVDASAVIELLLGTDVGREVAVHFGRGRPTLHAPELLGVETVSVLRRLVLVGDISSREARRAVDDLEALGVELYGHLPLLPRILELRNSLTAYDASYVALAEGLGADLLTCDTKLAAAHGHRAKVSLVTR